MFNNLLSLGPCTYITRVLNLPSSVRYESEGEHREIN